MNMKTCHIFMHVCVEFKGFAFIIIILKQLVFNFSVWPGLLICVGAYFTKVMKKLKH